MPKQVRWAALAALVVLLYILPNKWFYEYLGFPIGSEYFALYTTGSDFAAVLFDTAVFVLLAVGLNVVVGFAGLLDLGYVGFFAVGAYTVALLTSPESRLRARQLAVAGGGADRDRGGDDLRRDPRLARRCGCAATTWPS